MDERENDYTRRLESIQARNQNLQVELNKSQVMEETVRSRDREIAALRE